MRLYVFPGGSLEVTDYGDECNDEGRGVYLELWSPALPQRVPGAAVADRDLDTVEPADAETRAEVLRLLRDLP